LVPEKIEEISMRIKILGIVLTCILVLVSFHCQEKKPAVTFMNVAPKIQTKPEIPSVCIWDSSLVRSEPAQRGRLVSSLALGEKVFYLNEEKADSTEQNKKYLRIRLSDSQEGWVSENRLALDMKPAVAIQKAAIYLRPDLITITDKEFEPMDFVAVSKLENEWCEAKGLEGKKTGWIKSGFVSVKDDDIIVGLLAHKALAETTGIKKKEKLEAIIHNPSFSHSIFIDTLKYCLTRIPPWELDDSSPEGSEDSDESDESDD
jgi:hypothetical protein